MSAAPHLSTVRSSGACATVAAAPQLAPHIDPHIDAASAAASKVRRTTMKNSIALIALAVAPMAAGAQVTHADHAGIARATATPAITRVGVRRDGIRTITVTASDYAFAAP